MARIVSEALRVSPDSAHCRRAALNEAIDELVVVVKPLLWLLLRTEDEPRGEEADVDVDEENDDARGEGDKEDDE
jgi:hypothetical protein